MLGGGGSTLPQGRAEQSISCWERNAKPYALSGLAAGIPLGETNLLKGEGEIQIWPSLSVASSTEDNFKLL